MISHVVTLCLAAHPVDCRAVHLAFMDPVSPAACLWKAQGSLAMFDLPDGWVIRAWRCAGDETASR